MPSQDELKRAAAQEAIHYIETSSVVGVGTGSTVDFFIEQLATIKHKVDGAVASSIKTEKQLKASGIPVYNLNSVANLALYIDGADEFDPHLALIKGGGGAIAREKIVAAAAKQFICIVDESKQVARLGKFPVAVEVIPMARSYVAREIVKLGGDPVYRQDFVTDNGNLILDVYNFELLNAGELEFNLNNLDGVVANGICAKRCADKILLATGAGVKTISNPTY